MRAPAVSCCETTRPVSSDPRTAADEVVIITNGTSRAGIATHVGFGLTLAVLGIARALTGGAAGGIVYLSATLVPLAVVLTTLVRRPASNPGPWLFIIGALLCSTVHNVVWLVQVSFGGAAQATGPLAAVSLLLAYAGLLAAAIAVVVPIARGDGGAVVDSAIVSVSVAGLLWTLVLTPALDMQGASPGVRGVTLLSMLLVCGTTGAVARGAITAREARPTLGYLVLGAVAMLVATVLTATILTSGAGTDARVTDIVWIAAYTSLGAAAAHPSRRSLGSPGRPRAQTLTLPHLAVLGLAVCSNLLLAGVLELAGIGSDPALLIVGSLLVVPLFLVRVWQIAGLFETAQAELVRQARQDDLTGLPNRRSATAHLAETVRRVEDGSLTGARVCFLDLDEFKVVNDDHGHGAGDGVLVEMARRLRHAVRSDGFVARLGGDEFVVVLPCDGEDLEALTVTRIRDAVAEPLDVGATTITMDVSIGSVAFARGEGMTVERLLSLADARMYEDKRRERATR